MIIRSEEEYRGQIAQDEFKAQQRNLSEEQRETAKDLSIPIDNIAAMDAKDPFETMGITTISGKLALLAQYRTDQKETAYQESQRKEAELASKEVLESMLLGVGAYVFLLHFFGALINFVLIGASFLRFSEASLYTINIASSIFFFLAAIMLGYGVQANWFGEWQRKARTFFLVAAGTIGSIIALYVSRGILFALITHRLARELLETWSIANIVVFGILATFLIVLGWRKGKRK